MYLYHSIYALYLCHTISRTGLQTFFLTHCELFTKAPQLNKIFFPPWGKYWYSSANTMHVSIIHMRNQRYRVHLRMTEKVTLYFYCKHWENCHAKLSDILESLHGLANTQSQKLTAVKKTSKERRQSGQLYATAKIHSSSTTWVR